MIRQVRAELLKLRTTRTFFGLTAGAMAFSALAVAGVVQSSRRADNAFILQPRTFVALGTNAFLFVAALGVLTMAGESRHHTADHTYLASPRRWRVFLAKAGAVFLAGIALGIVAEATIFAIGLPWLAVLDVKLSFEAGLLGNLLLQLVAIGLVGVLGVGVAALLRNQVAALILLVGWLLIGENLLGLVFDGTAPYLVGGLVSSMVGARSLLPRWEAAALLICYLLAVCGLGCYLLERRDIA